MASLTFMALSGRAVQLFRLGSAPKLYILTMHKYELSLMGGPTWRRNRYIPIGSDPGNVLLIDRDLAPPEPSLKSLEAIDSSMLSSERRRSSSTSMLSNGLTSLFLMIAITGTRPPSRGTTIDSCGGDPDHKRDPT